MFQNNLITQKEFDSLLMWFSPDREKAGAKYEEIRNGLIRYFYLKGCSDAESLADEAINRVAKKVSTFDTDNSYKHITYFYGFASNIYLEYRRKADTKNVLFEPNIHSTSEKDDNFGEIAEIRQRCLEECLAILKAKESDLVLQYFYKEKSEKIDHRRKLAEQMNLTMGAMHIKVHRLKKVLSKCVKKCLKKNNV